MVKRGSITVFLALTLGLILSLLSSGLESVRMAATRTQILKQYGCWTIFFVWTIQQVPLKDYDLFAVDGAYGGERK